jgi:Helix-hairpin-helix motif
VNAENAVPLVMLSELRRPSTRLENDSVFNKPLSLTIATTALFVSLAAASPEPAINARIPPPPEARVDINHASLEELMKVPGMTPSWAARIIRFRPYRTKDDLVEQGVITSSVYKRIKDYVIAHRNAQ